MQIDGWRPAAATSYGDVAYLHGWTVAIGWAAASRMTKGAPRLGLREKATVSKLMAQYARKLWRGRLAHGMPGLACVPRIETWVDAAYPE